MRLRWGFKTLKGGLEDLVFIETQGTFLSASTLEGLTRNEEVARGLVSPSERSRTRVRVLDPGVSYDFESSSRFPARLKVCYMACGPGSSLLITAPGRVPSVGLVPGRQLGVSSDDEPGENWSPEWSFTGEMRYLILLLGIPYLGGVFGVPRYLTTCGDNTCGPSPSPSWGMKLLWAEPTGAYEFSADPRP
ncbi:hypothetical protein YC2023_010521 [Brassica napus]